MKTEDFDRLKALCEENDFELLNVDHEDNEKFYVIAKKKDSWDGVEFAEYIGDKLGYFTKGEKYKIFGNERISLIDDVSDCPDHKWSISGLKENFKPSTESAYVDQLKKEVFERFGEIKSADTFNAEWVYYNYKIGSNLPFLWRYDKEDDALYYGGAPFYKQGKWATRVRERVEVEFFDDSLDEHNSIEEWGYSFRVKNYNYGDKISMRSGQFLASQLEAYLNGEVK